MLYRLRFTLLLPLAALLACGSTASVSGANPTPSGDYAFTIAPAGVTTLNFSGSLNVVGPSYSGVFRYNNPSANCVSNLQNIPFSGSAVNGVVTLTSGTFSGSTATITFPLPLTAITSGEDIANGTAVISGGTCAVASSPFQLTYIPPFGATWNGVLTGPVNASLALSITESPANADGQFPVVAAVNVTGATCNLALTGVTGLVSGYGLSMGGTGTGANSEVAIGASATTSPVNVTMNVFANGSGVNCPIGTYIGTIQ
jgi:hypothetical protein